MVDNEPVKEPDVLNCRLVGLRTLRVGRIGAAGDGSREGTAVVAGGARLEPIRVLRARAGDDARER